MRCTALLSFGAATSEMVRDKVWDMLTITLQCLANIVRPSALWPKRAGPSPRV
jgi:hypothetical protein